MKTYHILPFLIIRSIFIWSILCVCVFVYKFLWPFQRLTELYRYIILRYYCELISAIKFIISNQIYFYIQEFWSWGMHCAIANTVHSTFFLIWVTKFASVITSQECTTHRALPSEWVSEKPCRIQQCKGFGWFLWMCMLLEWSFNTKAKFFTNIVLWTGFPWSHFK